MEVVVSDQDVNQVQVDSALEDEINACISSPKLDFPIEFLTEFLNSKEMSWHFQEGVRRIGIIDTKRFSDDAYDQYFYTIADIALKKLLEKEDPKKFTVLINDLNRAIHNRADATKELVTSFAEKIKQIAKKAYLESK